MDSSNKKIIPQTNEKMKHFKIINSDIDRVTAIREITGRITYSRFKILNRYARRHTLSRGDLRCHHEHDCCGCKCGQDIELKVYHNKAIFTLTKSFNY